MKQGKHTTAAGNSQKRYASPRTRVVFVRTQGVLCGSPYGDNTEKFTVGDNNYEESDWE